MSNPVVKSQQTTVASAAETTIVTADPNFNLQLFGLIITTANNVFSQLTLRDSTGGAVVAVFDYPPGAATAPPLIIPFNPPLPQTLLKNNNWTLQASSNGAGYHVTALFNEA